MRARKIIINYLAMAMAAAFAEDSASFQANAQLAQNSPTPLSTPKAGVGAPAAVSRSQSGNVIGIVTQVEPTGKKGEAFLMLKAEGAKEATRYLLAAPGGDVDPKLQAALKSVFPTNLVKLEWKGQDLPVVTGIHTMFPSARTGFLSGAVIDRSGEGKDVSIDVKPDGQPTERYLPNWVAGGWNKEVCAAIAATNIGDRVKIRWFYDERRRVVELSVVSKAVVPRAPAARPGSPSAAPTSPAPPHP